MTIIVAGRWKHLGSPTEPGEYPLELDGKRYRVQVRPQDIERAQATGGPEGVFRAGGPNHDSVFSIVQIRWFG